MEAQASEKTEEKEEVIYPFLKPGQVKEIEGGVSVILQTGNFTVRTADPFGKKMIQITVKDAGRYVQVPAEQLSELIVMLHMANDAMRLEKR